MKVTLTLLYFFCAVLFASLNHDEIDSLILCYKSKMEMKEGPEKYDIAFSNFNKKDLYKMFIDKKRLANPKPDEIRLNSKLKYLFDRGKMGESGYYRGMKNAFNLMRTKIGENVTLEMLIQFHDTAVGQITKKRKGTSSGWYYHLSPEIIDPNAMKELVDSRIVLSPKEILENISNGRNTIVTTNEDFKFLDPFKDLFFSSLLKRREGMRFIGQFPDESVEIEKKIAPIILYYYYQIQKVETLKGKISAIAELLRALEVGHFFPDGNQRTYAFLLMNKLLIENNIPPAILEDPTIFDGWCSLETMTNEIYNGIKNFLNNDFGKQQLFLNGQCQLVSSVANYLIDNDYYPFYKIGFGKGIENRIYSQLRAELMESIDKNKIEEKDIHNLKPLSKAIIIADEDLIDKLLSLGANPYCAENIIDSPFLTAVRFFNYEVAKKLLSHMDLENFTKKFIEMVIDILLESFSMAKSSQMEEEINEIAVLSYAKGNDT